jgi:hypothetical protein
MNAEDVPAPPESWDESPGLRRFWWVLWPLGIAVWAAAALVILDKQNVLVPFGSNVTNAIDRFEQQLPVEPGQRFVIQNIHGALRIEDGPPGEATIVVERRGTGRSADEARAATAGLNHRISIEGDAVVLIIAGVSGRKLPVTATVTLTIPPGTRVEAETLFGDIQIQPSGSASVAAGTANGNIEVTIPREAAISARLEANELKTEFDMVRVAAPGTSTLFESPGSNGQMVDLNLRAPEGSVTLRRR